MPSFDIVSEIDAHELTNAVDQANREVNTRFDFKGSNAHFILDDHAITSKAPSEFQVQQMLDILQTKLAKRSIDPKCLEIGSIESNLNEAKQVITIKQGIDKAFAKKLVKLIKDSKLKVQTAVQEEQIRVTGKKRDDLQDVIGVLKNTDLDLPLQYINFRD